MLGAKMRRKKYSFMGTYGVSGDPLWRGKLRRNPLNHLNPPAFILCCNVKYKEGKSIFLNCRLVEHHLLSFFSVKYRLTVNTSKNEGSAPLWQARAHRNKNLWYKTLFWIWVFTVFFQWGDSQSHHLRLFRLTYKDQSPSWFYAPLNFIFSIFPTCKPKSLLSPGNIML